jgi:hypothetical protein
MLCIKLVSGKKCPVELFIYATFEYNFKFQPHSHDLIIPD